MLLLTRPKHDLPTHYLFYWSEIFIAEAKKRNLKIVDLAKKRATKENLHSYLSSKQPIGLVILNGHGSAHSVYGHDNETLMSLGEELGLLKDKEMFVRACDAASSFGVEVKKMGAASFIGYNQPFMFPIDKESIRKPLNDKLAGPLLECSNQVGLSLIKGKPAKKAQEESISKYRERIAECLSSKTTSTLLLPFLLWNMNAQVCYS